MKFFSSDKIHAADEYTMIHEPIASIYLMERAANQVANWISRHIEKEFALNVFVGPGNNGGDGWAVARLLVKKGFTNITVYLLDIGKSLSPDAEINRKRLLKESQVVVKNISSTGDFPQIIPGGYIIDALFGSGLSRPLEGLAADLVKFINKSQKRGVIAIDVPSGLFCEDNTNNNLDHIIRADFTLTFEFPKLSFFFPENEAYTGKWRTLPIGIHQGFVNKEPTSYNYITEDDLRDRLKIRNKYSHKGTFGHALLIAGSYGMMGASVLATRAATRAGSGLVTTHVPRLGVDILQVAVPESLLSIDESDILFTNHPSLSKYTSIAIGPGLNQKTNTKTGLINLLKECQVPIILDADALNILAGIENWKDILPDNSILTPHPKEYERLFGPSENSYHRLKQQVEFSVKKNSVLVVKGANTCITTPDGAIWFNTSGNPGMATGGSGDVLTGIILGLTAQNYSNSDAAVIGVYLHGMAGDLASQKHGQHGMIASDIVDNIGIAFSVLEKKKV